MATAEGVSHPKPIPDGAAPKRQPMTIGGAPSSPPRPPTNLPRVKKIGAPVPKHLRPTMPSLKPQDKQANPITSGVHGAAVSGPNEEPQVSPATRDLAAPTALSRGGLPSASVQSLEQRIDIKPEPRENDTVPRSLSGAHSTAATRALGTHGRSHDDRQRSSSGGGATFGSYNPEHRPGKKIQQKIQQGTGAARSTVADRGPYDDDVDDDVDDDDDAPRVFVMPTELQYVHRVSSSSPPEREVARGVVGPAVSSSFRQKTTNGPHGDGRSLAEVAGGNWRLEEARQESPSPAHDRGGVPRAAKRSPQMDKQLETMRLEEYLVELLVEGRHDEYAQLRHVLDQRLLHSADTPSDSSREPTAPAFTSKQSTLDGMHRPNANEAEVEGSAIPTEVYWQLVDEL